MKLTASAAALLLASSAMAQTATPAAPAAPDTAAPAPATPPPAAAAPAPAPAAPAVAAPAPAPAPAPAAAPAAPAFKFALHGFVSMSAAYQTGSFVISEGQQSLASNTNAGSAGTGAPTATVPDKNTLTFDVRQSRLNFSVAGPQVLAGATPSAVVELDFFQGFGGGNYGDVNLLNRLRLAYTELNWGNHKLQFGQQNDIVFAMAPTSLSHIAFPLGFFTGNIGWRRPGIFGFHTFQLPNEVKVEGAWEIGRAQWADLGAGTGVPASGIGGAGASPYPPGINLGEASSAPAVEGRVTGSYAKYLTAFVAGHWNQIDTSGYGSGLAGAGISATPSATYKKTVDTVAYNAGLKLIIPVQNDVSVTLAGTGFTGKNIAPLTGNFTTGAAAFKLGPNGEDVHTTGWWAQAGLNLTKEFSVWGFYGDQQIDKTDFVRALYGANAAYENTTTNLIAMYRDGGYALSAEWINFNTKYSSTVDTTANKITSNHTSKSDQYILTANYFF